MADHRLQREIESLLRGHYRVSLAPTDVRIPVLGSTSVALPQSRTLSLDLAYILYHGWLYTQDASQRVATESTIQSYLAGAGTAVPGHSAVLMSGRMVPGSTPSWPDGAPALDGDGVYSPAGIWPTSPPSEHAHWYSGLMILGAQASIGAGQATSRWLGTGWSAASTDRGLIRTFDAAGSPLWWSAVADVDGVRVQRLVVPSAASALVDWLAAGTLSDEAATMVEAWCLAMAELSTDAPIVLVAAGDITPCYRYGSTAMVTISPYHGWCWRHQAWGAADEAMPGAVLTVQCSDGSGTGWRCHSRQSVIQIGYGSDGVPSAGSTTLTVGGDHSWALHRGYDRIMVVYPGGLSSELNPPPEMAGTKVAGSAKLHAFFRRDGTRCDVSYNGAQTVSATVSPALANQFRLVGGAGDTAMKGEAWTTADTGGFTAGTLSVYRPTAGTVFIETAVYTLVETLTPAAPSGIPAGSYAYAFQTNTAPTWTDPSNPPQRIGNYFTAGSLAFFRAETRTVSAGGRILVLSRSPECAWMLGSYSGTRNSSQSHQRDNQLNPWKWDTRNGASNPWILGCLWGNPGAPGAPTLPCASYHSWSVLDSATESGAAWAEWESHCVTAEGEHSGVGDAAYWSPVVEASGSLVPAAAVSYGGIELVTGVAAPTGLYAGAASTDGSWIGAA